MQSRSLTLLAVVAVAAAGAALWLSGERRAVTETDSAGLLVPGLIDELNNISQVVVRGADETVTLNRGDAGWSVEERGGFPANMQTLRQQLMALGNAKLMEKKTANPDNYGVLGVEDISPGAGGTEVTLAGIEQPVTVILGNQNFQGGSSTYVRRGDESQSWLASGSLRMEAKATAWLRKDVINVSAKRIRQVTLTHPDGQLLRIMKTSAELPNYLVLDVPEGRELLSPSSGNSIAGALASLRLDDVHPAAEVTEPDEGVVVGVFETFDGLRVTARAWQVDDIAQVSLSVAYAPELAATDEDDAQTADDPVEDAAAEAASAEASEAEQDLDVEAEVETLRSAVDGWVFQVPSYKFSNMSKTMDDLLKALETESDVTDSAPES